jgi:peptidoglycan glycosyltransferase
VNKPIRTMSIFCMALFMALLLNATYLQYLQADELNSHNANKRVRDAEFSRERGAILVSGTSVARSEPVDDEFEFQRTYPQPQKYSHLTGYYSYTYGRNAVELTHNEILSGSDPRLFVNRVVDLFGNSEPEGGDVTLTIDPRAQSAAYDGLRALGNNVEGAVVALDPSTGGILAMVSSPSYDPNRLASHNLGRVQDSWEQLQDHPGEPMLNRTIQDVYPPGSTFKLVTAAAALSSGQYTPESTVPGGFQLEFPAGEPIPNDGGGNCGGQRISLTQALMVSCNVSFGHIGVQLGADTLQEQAQKFGFGERYLEDLNGQVASRFPEELEEDVFVAQSAIGQFDVAATPLQMAMVTAGIANGGTVMKPYLVDEVRSPDLEPLEKTTPEPFRTAVSADVARDLTQMMIEVVDQGTATPAQIPGMKVAGKTGTAQSSPSRPPYAWFVSFAPADNPQVAVAVLVEDAGVERDAISGSGLAAPIAKRVMEAVINR